MAERIRSLEYLLPILPGPRKGPPRRWVPHFGIGFIQKPFRISERWILPKIEPLSAERRGLPCGSRMPARTAPADFPAGRHVPEGLGEGVVRRHSNAWGERAVSGKVFHELFATPDRNLRTGVPA